MRPITVSLGPYAAGVANGISTAQALPQAGPFVINGALTSGGAAVLDNPRQVAITSAGNDSLVYFNIVGYDALGDRLGEKVLGANGGVVTTNNLFKRVTGATSSGPTSSVTIGTASAPFASRAIRLDEWANEACAVHIAIQAGAVFTVQHSFDDPNDLINPVPQAAMFWDSALIPPGGIAGSVGLGFSIATAPLWIRLLLNSAAGSAKMVVTQYNVVNP